MMNSGTVILLSGYRVIVCWLLLPATGFLILHSWYIPCTRNEQIRFVVTCRTGQEVHILVGTSALPGS